MSNGAAWSPTFPFPKPTGARVHAPRERARVHLKRNPRPSDGIVDSRSVKTTGVDGEQG
jgi:hypothetical protein